MQMSDLLSAAPALLFGRISGNTPILPQQAKDRRVAIGALFSQIEILLRG
jgi:hypothetical protein